MKNQYIVIDKALKEHEEFRYAQHSLSWIANRIDWAYKWRHISYEEMTELAQRIIYLLDRDRNY